MGVHEKQITAASAPSAIDADHMFWFIDENGRPRLKDELGVLTDFTGSELLNGSGAPAGGLGKIGDFYLNTHPSVGTGDVYKKTGVSTWTLQGNIRGATGLTGPTGEVSQATLDTAIGTRIPTSYLDTDVLLAANSDTKIATQKAVKAYADAIAGVDATYTTHGLITATEKIELNSLDGRTNTGTNKRVFRPGDYMVGNAYDPTGAVDSTPSFSAMMTALRAFNDRCTIQLSPGVFKIDHDILKDFGTNNPSVSIIGPGRGLCVLLPNSAPATDKSAMIIFNRGTTGGDAITVRGFTIYNTSGAVYIQGAGIRTNGADGIDISEVAFIDLFRDIQVSGQPYTMTTNGTTAVTIVSPGFTAADLNKPVTGAGIVPGTTLVGQAGASGTLSQAATNSTADTRYIENSIKVSMQKIVSFNTNGAGVGIYVNNGQAGDTYMGPDIVMSDGGGTTRRRACIEIIESGHYEIVQCNLTGSQVGLLIDPGASQSVAFGFHTNILCDSNIVNGMDVNAALASSTIKNIKSVNSWYSGTTNAVGSAAAAGVITRGAGNINGFTFTTDRFLLNRTHGFQHGAGTDFRWSDCDMKGNSTVGAGVNDGLNIAAGVSNCSVSGGKYGGTDSGPTGTQRYGINVLAGAGNNIKIGADDLTGNQTGPLSFNATGISNFINGCPGLASPYVRGTSSATIGATQITVANIRLPAGSLRVSSSFRLKANFTQAAAITAGTFRVCCGTAVDAVGAASTNPVVVSAVSATGAANGFGEVEFTVTISVIGAGTGTIQGSGRGSLSTTAASAVTASFATPANVRAANAGFLASLNTAVDLYLTLSMACTASTLTVHNSSIEVLNY